MGDHFVEVNKTINMPKGANKDIDDIMPVLGYVTWCMFSEAINWAKEVCKLSNQSIAIFYRPTSFCRRR